MTWNLARATERINQLKSEFPTIKVEEFAEYFSRYQILAEDARRARTKAQPPLFNIRPSEAIIVDGVHVYADVIAFRQMLFGNFGESEESHRDALTTLHLQYSAFDRVIEKSGAQRVDYHGPRMHAVVVEPAGANNVGVRVQRALELANSLIRLTDVAIGAFGGRNEGLCVGIDSGQCVAINSGRGSEPEPLFLGNAANYAAKLAAKDERGIFLSDNVQKILDAVGYTNVFQPLDDYLEGRQVGRLNHGRFFAESLGNTSIDTEALLLEWRKELQLNNFAARPVFSFHHQVPPLKSIDYADLSPSNSIRMPLVSIFADLDCYTNYIASSMNNLSKAAEAVRNLHVIRKELANVIQMDFGGRKVRFVGDCIHGMVAEGTRVSTDEMETVAVATHCVGALRSSFDLCKKLLTGADTLGIAIGFELGSTPVSRIGIRGDRGVRVSTSVAVMESESEQGRCDGTQTAIGPVALNAGSADVRRIFGLGRVKDNLDFDTAFLGVPLGGAVPASPAVVRSEGTRAHCAS